MKARILIACLALVLPLCAAAQTNTWSSDFRIASVQSVASAGFVIVPDGGIVDGCVKFRVYGGRNGINIDGVKMQMAMALVAFATGRTVAAYYDSSNTNCYVRYLEVLDH